MIKNKYFMATPELRTFSSVDSYSTNTKVLSQALKISSKLSSAFLFMSSVQGLFFTK